MRSYFLSVRSRNARPSSMCAVDARVGVRPVRVMRLRRGRTAAGRSRPRRRASPRASARPTTSFPPPAPMTSTSSSLWFFERVVGLVVHGVRLAFGPVRGEVRLVREPVDVDEQRAGDLLRGRGLDLVVRRPARPGAERLEREHDHDARRRPATCSAPVRLTRAGLRAPASPRPRSHPTPAAERGGTRARRSR